MLIDSLLPSYRLKITQHFIWGIIPACWQPTDSQFSPFHRFHFPNRVPWVTRQVVMWPLCHHSYPTPPTAWCPVPWRRESLPESPAPACPHPPCMRTHHLTASNGKKGLTEMDLNSLPNGGTCPSDFGVSRRVTKLFSKHSDRTPRTSNGIRTRSFGFDDGPLSTETKTRVLTVFIQDHQCVALSTSGVFLIRRGHFFVLMRMIFEDV